MRLVTLMLAVMVLGACDGQEPLGSNRAQSTTSPLPVLHPVPPFRFEDHTGATFDATRLAGKVWVLNTFLVCCPGKCPEMTKGVRELQDATPGLTDLCFLSVTSDPKNESAEDLAGYASKWGADPTRWFFARSASAEATHEFLFKGLKVDGDAVNPINHSFRLVLVDRHGRVRGYYRSLEVEERRRLLEDAKRLVAEK